MNLKFLLFSICIATIFSCSNKYKITQTPDDVYYSPVRAIEEDSNNDNENNVSHPSSEDREIRMSRYDRRWTSFNDDYNYSYDPYHYGYNYGYYYNPFYYQTPFFISTQTVQNSINTAIRTTSLTSYNFQNNPISNIKSGPIQFTKPERSYNNSNNNYNIRNIISPNNNNSSGDNNTRTYSPSSNSSSGGNSSSGTSITRPRRG